MVPSHELALQIEGVFKDIGKYTGLSILAIIGGVDQEPQIASLNKGVDIVIATPGRMFDLISQKFLRTESIETLVLDEADYMLDLGFKVDIAAILTKLPKRRQTLFFSATINDKIKRTAYSIVRQNAIRIQLSPKDPVAKNIDHFFMYTEMDHKRYFLERLIKENPDAKVLAFVRTRVRAERVSKAMARVGISSLTIHGEKEQDDRTAVMEKFRNGEEKLLIGTDVTARGIDIPDIAMVVNYDLPDNPENYVHRVGRTGRAKKKGLAYSFVAEQEVELLEEIEEFLQKSIAEISLDDDVYFETLNSEKAEKNPLEMIEKEIEEFEQRKKRKKKS